NSDTPSSLASPVAVRGVSETCQRHLGRFGSAIVRPCTRSQIRPMAFLRNGALRRTNHRSHTLPLAALVGGTLVLATMLAYEAHDAARSHKATAERALHDYAEVAAWELVAGANDELRSTLGGALAPLTRARATTPYELLPAPNVLEPTADGILRCPGASGADDS